MTKISKVAYCGKTIELAFPIYLSDDDLRLADTLYDLEHDAKAADAYFLFYIIQKEIAQLMMNKEEEEK